MTSPDNPYRHVRRPLAVTIVAYLFVAAGAVGSIYHALELMEDGQFQYEAAWVIAIRVLAVLAGVYMLRGANWGRWLAVAWLAYQVASSAFRSMPEAVVHALLLAAVASILFRSVSSAYYMRDRRARVQ